MSLNPENIKKALKSSDLKQFTVLHKMIVDGKVLNQSQQKKYDSYLAEVEASDQERPDSVFVIKSADTQKFFNISAESLSKWCEMPSFPKTAKSDRYGYYDIKQIYDWHLLYFYGDADTAKQMAIEKLKYQVARSERERLETDELHGRLVRREDYNQRLVEVAVTTKDALMLWAKTLPPEMALRQEDQKRVMKILDKKARQILTTMAQGLDAVKKYTKGK